jgi:transposase
VYVIAGHKGHPEIVAELGRKGRRRRLKGKRGRGTLADEKPPIFGMLQREGEIVIAMLPNVQRATIEPLIQQTIQTGSRVYTDEYDIYNHLGEAGYTHKTVNMPATKMAMGSMKSMSTRWKASGPCCAHGFAPIEASHKKNCHRI